MSWATMLKLTLILCVAMYAGLVIYSDPSVAPDTPQVAEDAEAPPLATMQQALQTADDGAMTLTTEDGQVLEIAAVIAPGTGARRGTGQPDAPEPDTTPSDAGAASPPTETQTDAAQDRGLSRVAVNGSAVNLRAGPSTDTDILASLPRGTEADLLADVGDGWALIRVRTSGVEGYMADRFLDAVN